MFDTLYSVLGFEQNIWNWLSLAYQEYIKKNLVLKTQSARKSVTFVEASSLSKSLSLGGRVGQHWVVQFYIGKNFQLFSKTQIL